MGGDSRETSSVPGGQPPRHSRHTLDPRRQPHPSRPPAANPQGAARQSRASRIWRQRGESMDRKRRVFRAVMLALLAVSGLVFAQQPATPPAQPPAGQPPATPPPPE